MDAIIKYHILNGTFIILSPTSVIEKSYNIKIDPHDVITIAAEHE